MDAPKTSFVVKVIPSRIQDLALACARQTKRGAQAPGNDVIGHQEQGHQHNTQTFSRGLQGKKHLLKFQMLCLYGCLQACFGQPLSPRQGLGGVADQGMARQI
jgi:hypothetical protein